MELIELTEKDRANYNHFVACQPSGSFLQGWEWGGWQARLGRRVYRFKIEDNSNQIASIQFIKMPLPLGKFYLYAPYGPVADSRFKIEDIRYILKEIRQKFPEAIFLRVEPKFNYQLSAVGSQLVKSSNIQPGKTLIIDLSKAEEVLLSEMHHKTRYNIKVAQKHGVEIQDEFVLNIGKGFYFEEAIDLLVKTASRQGFGGYNKTYYGKLVDFFALQNNKSDLKLHVYKAVFQNQLLASAIMLDFGRVRTFLFGGSSEDNKNVMAPYLMHWQAILDAKTQGKNFYDFWGIETSSGETPGFVRFKLGFGGEEKNYAGASDIINQPLWYRAYNSFRWLNKVTKKIRL